MGYYFAQFGLRKKTNNLYFKFLESFKDSIGDILFSSLNYDLILELAAGINGFLIDYFSQTPGINKISILKLHGSCNFLLGQLEATGSITFTAGVTFSSGLKAVNPNEAMALCQSNTALYPAMCLYMKSKETQIGYDELIAV